MTEPISDATSDKYVDALRRFSSDLRMVQQVWQSMHDRGVAPTADHWRLYLDAHVANRDAAGAAAVADEMRAAGFPTDSKLRWDLALAAIRSGNAASGHAQLAALREEGEQPPDELLPKLFSVQITSGDLQAARATLRQMAARGQAAQPAEYQVLLRDVLDRRAIKDGKALMEAMLKAGVTPTQDDAAAVVSMMARAGHPDRAEATAATLTQGGVELDQQAVTDIALAYAKKGELEQARKLLGVVDEAGGHIDSYTRNGMLAAIASSGDVEAAWDEALVLAERAVPSGSNLEALFDLAHGAGNHRRALGAIDWMLMLGVPVPTNKVADAIGGLLKHGELDIALDLYRETTARGVTPDRRRAKDLVDALVKAGRLDEAKAFLTELRTSKTLTNGRHYGSLLAALLRAKRRDEAMALLNDMLEGGVQPTASDASRMVGGLLKAGELDEARSLLTRFAEAKIGVDEETYRELMWAYAQKNQVEPAQEIFQRMVDAGITPDDRHHKALQWASGETVRRLEEPAEIPPQPDTAAPAATTDAEAEASTTPAVVPDPEPQPVPDPEPQPVPDPEPQPAPDPEPQPAPEPEPQPVPEPEPQPAPEPEPQLAPDPEPSAVEDPPVASESEQEPVVPDPPAVDESDAVTMYVPGDPSTITTTLGTDGAPKDS